MLVTLIDRREALHQDALAATATLARAPISAFLHHASPQALTALVTREATALSFADAFYVLALFGFIVAPLVLILRTRPAAGPATLPAE